LCISGDKTAVFIAFHIIRVPVYNLLCFRLSNQTQGRILTLAGVTAAICSAPVAAFSNLVAIAVWPTWVAVAICETVRKVCHHWSLACSETALWVVFLSFFLSRLFYLNIIMLMYPII
jgi:hypothetical protein